MGDVCRARLQPCRNVVRTHTASAAGLFQFPCRTTLQAVTFRLPALAGAALLLVALNPGGNRLSVEDRSAGSTTPIARPKDFPPANLAPAYGTPGRLDFPAGKKPASFPRVDGG